MALAELGAYSGKAQMIFVGCSLRPLLGLFFGEIVPGLFATIILESPSIVIGSLPFHLAGCNGALRGGCHYYLRCVSQAGNRCLGELHASKSLRRAQLRQDQFEFSMKTPLEVCASRVTFCVVDGP